MAASGVPRLASCFFAISTALGDIDTDALLDGALATFSARGALSGSPAAVFEISDSMFSYFASPPNRSLFRAGSQLALHGSRGRCPFEGPLGRLLLLEILDGALDGVFGEHR